MTRLYSVSVPVLLRYLERMDGILETAQAHILSSGREEPGLLREQLRDGMFDVRQQFLITMNFAIRALRPFAFSLQEIAEPQAETIAELRQQLGERIRAIESLDPDEINSKEDLIVAERAGEAHFEASSLVFLTQYALPNFFFHFMTAYCLLRRAGVPLGKADFDGFHSYPAGFRFV